MANFPSPSSPRPREDDPRIQPEANGISFQAGSPGAEWLASMTPSKTIKASADPGRIPKAASSHGVVVPDPPPSQKNLFGSEAGEPHEPPPAAPSAAQLQFSLIQTMAEDLERSRALMDQRFEDLQAREDILQITISEGIQFALDQYVKNNPMINVNADNSSDPLIKAPDVARDSGTQLIHPIQTAIQKICGSLLVLTTSTIFYHESLESFIFCHDSKQYY